MSLVIDCSATLAWVYPDGTTDASRRVFDLVLDEGAFVPALWRLEVANGLTMAFRRRRISGAFRADALNALALAPISVDADTDAQAWSATLQLAGRFGLTLYDAAYLELAIQIRHLRPALVIPAKAGTHLSAARAVEAWIPAFAGMTKREGSEC